MRRMLHERHTLRTSPEKAGANRLLWSELRGGGDRLVVAAFGPIVNGSSSIRNWQSVFHNADADPRVISRAPTPCLATYKAHGRS